MYISKAIHVLILGLLSLTASAYPATHDEDLNVFVTVSLNGDHSALFAKHDSKMALLPNYKSNQNSESTSFCKWHALTQNVGLHAYTSPREETHPLALPFGKCVQHPTDLKQIPFSCSTGPIEYKGFFSYDKENDEFYVTADIIYTTQAADAALGKTVVLSRGTYGRDTFGDGGKYDLDFKNGVVKGYVALFLDREKNGVLAIVVFEADGKEYDLDVLVRKLEGDADEKTCVEVPQEMFQTGLKTQL